jgi:hypothetical protein
MHTPFIPNDKIGEGQIDVSVELRNYNRFPFGDDGRSVARSERLEKC